MIYFFGALLLASTLAAAVYRRMQRRPEDSGRAMSRGEARRLTVGRDLG